MKDPLLMPSVVSFKNGDLVVYPAHGVGRLESIETQVVSGFELQVFVISFIKNRMTLRLPMTKAKEAGLRSLSAPQDVNLALATLKEKSIPRKGIWARRAQEYEVKIASGHLSAIAEVIRDLYRNGNPTEQSFSERQLYQSALGRLASEIAAIEDIEEGHAIAKVQSILEVA